MSPECGAEDLIAVAVLSASVEVGVADVKWRVFGDPEGGVEEFVGGVEAMLRVSVTRRGDEGAKIKLAQILFNIGFPCGIVTDNGDIGGGVVDGQTPGGFGIGGDCICDLRCFKVQGLGFLDRYCLHNFVPLAAVKGEEEDVKAATRILWNWQFKEGGGEALGNLNALIGGNRDKGRRMPFSAANPVSVVPAGTGS